MKNPITEQEISVRLRKLPGWSFQDDKLQKSFEFADFRTAMSFLIRVSYEAEQQNHHPEIQNCYNKVSFSLNTHDAGGKVTDKDFSLAGAIDGIAPRAF